MQLSAIVSLALKTIFFFDGFEIEGFGAEVSRNFCEDGALPGQTCWNVSSAL